jgi:predicted dienelactone hydrolase
MKLALVYGMLGLLSATQVCAEPVGETHRVTSEKTASLRDAGHRDQLRITVWYPAAADAVERPLVVGSPERPLRNIGSVAADAAFAAGRTQWPVILLSHGFGGTARIMGWFGIAMARWLHRRCRGPSRQQWGRSDDRPRRGAVLGSGG